MTILDSIATKAKDNMAAAALAAISVGLGATRNNLALILVGQIERLELAKYLILTMSLVLMCLAWVAYLYVRIASRASAHNFDEYHPNIGVTVFRNKPRIGVEIDTNIWYCPRCLTVDHKLAHVNARHDKPGMWQCVDCKLEVHCFAR